MTSKVDPAEVERDGWEQALRVALADVPNACACKEWKCHHHNLGREVVQVGRCRSGKRWFWRAESYSCKRDSDEVVWHGGYGRADTEVDATNAILTALLARTDIIRLAFSSGYAADKLKALNAQTKAERIAAKPPSDETAPATGRELGFLYSRFYKCSDACYADLEPNHECYTLCSWPITKITAQRIYFEDSDSRYDRNYFIRRDAFDGDGSVYHAKVREVLYREPPLVRAARRVPDPNLADLRKAMADAHPDRGGNRDDFQQARASYLRAKQRAG